MTCIIGISSKGKVFIGADSSGSDGFSQEIRIEPKVFKNGDFIIGCTSSFRMIDLLKWKFNPPTLKNGENIHKFMCTDFVDSIHSLFNENGFSITTEDWKTGVMLVGIQGRLFKIESDFQISEHEYTSCGSGSYHAMGAMYCLSRKNPTKDIIKSLEASEYFVTTVKRPFIVESL